MNPSGRSCWWGSGRRGAGIAATEWKLMVRSPILRLACVVCWGLAVLLVHGIMSIQTRGFISFADPADLAAGAINLQIGLFAPSMLAFLAATTAARDRGPGIPETLYATPPSTEEFVVGRFLAVVMAGAVLFVGTVASGWLWLRYVEGVTSDFKAFDLILQGWWHGLLYVLCIGYAAGLILPGAAGGALVVFYLLAAVIASTFVTPLLVPFRGDTSPGYLLLGAALVLTAAVTYRRGRRGRHLEQAAPIVLAGATMAILGVGSLGRAVMAFDIPPFHRDRALDQERLQKAVPGNPLPPFHLYFSHGGRQLFKAQSGRPTLLLFGEDGPLILGVLPPARALAEAARTMGASGPRIVLVLLARDPTDAALWGQLIGANIETASLPWRWNRPPTGLPGMLGIDWPRARFGAVAVLDRQGRYLGNRSLYDLVRPRSLDTLLGSLMVGGPAAETGGFRTNYRSEVASARAFLEALDAYERPDSGVLGVERGEPRPRESTGRRA